MNFAFLAVKDYRSRGRRRRVACAVHGCGICGKRLNSSSCARRPIILSDYLWRKRTPRPANAYSMRSAFIGEIEAARLAGIMAAMKAQTAKAPAAVLSANGSQLETPYNCAEIS